MSDDAASATLAEVGEFGVIDRLVDARRQGPGVVLGPGDDGAVLTAPDGRVVVTTDMLVEGRHFRFDWAGPHDVGRKAIAQNAADIEAMGASPTGFVVALGAPSDTRVGQLDALADGMWEEAQRVGAGIVGGDLVASPQWVVSVTALGDLCGGEPVTRAGATAGSVIAVCGELGLSAAGYTLWQNEIDGFELLRRRHLVPEPPYGQGIVAAAAGAGAMTDVSDGLIADLRHIAQSSAVGIDLASAALAPDRDALAEAAAAVVADPWSWVLGGGEDHALVATFPAAVPDGWRAIGVVLDGPARVLIDGDAWEGYEGWQSFG